MKRLILFCFVYLFSFNSSFANNNSFTVDNSILTPPTEVKYNLDQAKHFYNVAGGCLYLHLLQNKHATMAFLLDGSQNSQDWMTNTQIESSNWLQTAIYLEDLLVNQFKQNPTAMFQYKNEQLGKLNNFFAQMFMETDTREYFTKLLNSTSFCAMNKPALFEFIELADKAIKESNPPVDKPTRKM